MRESTNIQGKGLLSAYTVLDLTDVKGQLCGKILADLGAMVIKLEPPAGDPARDIGPFVDDRPGPDRGLLWLALNTGKKSVTIDLETTNGQMLFRRLAKDADILLESFAPGYLDRLGMGYKSLSRQNPKLIMTAITPFGQTGPYAGYAGPDLICMAMGGHMNLCGDPEKRPLRISVPQAYAHASVQAALGTLFALWHRHYTGKGQFVDVSAQEAIIWEGFHNQSLWYMNRVNIRREGAWRRFGASLMRTLFPCKNGYVVVYILGGRIGAKGQRALVRWMDSEGMADDFLRQFDWDAFGTDNFKTEVARELEERLLAFFKTKTKGELFERAMQDKFLLAPVYTTQDIIESKHLKLRKFWTEVYHPKLDRTILYPGAPYKSSRPHYAVRGPAPALDQDSETILSRVSDATAGNPNSINDIGVTKKAIKQGMVFDGLKILDFSWTGVGPAATRFFADYGAQVVHVESRSRLDVLRLSPPFKDGISDPDRSGYFANYNTNKYGVTLDLKNPKGLEVAKKLVLWSDVVVESFSPGVITRLGLGYEDLRTIKPGIIMASTSQLGQNGPLSSFAGYGTQAAGLSGFWSITGYDDGEPTGLYGAYCDFVAHSYLAIAILMAIEEKRRSGLGQYIDQSQVESSIHFLAPALLDAFVNGRISRPTGNRDPDAAPHNAYRCKGEDQWCTIAIFSEKQWQALKAIMGYPPWTEDERFATLPARKLNENELDRLMDNWTRKYEANKLMIMLQEKGVPAGVVARAEDLHKDPQLAHRGHFIIVNHKVIGSYPCDAPAFRLSAAGLKVSKPSPCLGEHNKSVVTEILGCSEGEYARLKDEGAFG